MYIMVEDYGWTYEFSKHNESGETTQQHTRPTNLVARNSHCTLHITHGIRQIHYIVVVCILEDTREERKTEQDQGNL